MTSQIQVANEKSANFAARLAAYCEEHALSLGGLVDELAAGEPFDAIRAARLAAYCKEHALTLGGMVDELLSLRLALIFSEQEQQMRACMGCRENYDLAAIRDVIRNYETTVGYDSNGAKVARAVLAERLAECQEDVLDYAFADESDVETVRQQEEALILAMRLRSLMDMRDDFAKRGKLVLLEKTIAMIDALCAEVVAA
jgi:hypothetical protein